MNQESNQDFENNANKVEVRCKLKNQSSNSRMEVLLPKTQDNQSLLQTSGVIFYLKNVLQFSFMKIKINRGTTFIIDIFRFQS